MFPVYDKLNATQIENLFLGNPKPTFVNITKWCHEKKRTKTICIHLEVETAVNQQLHWSNKAALWQKRSICLSLFSWTPCAPAVVFIDAAGDSFGRKCVWCLKLNLAQRFLVATARVTLQLPLTCLGGLTPMHSKRHNWTSHNGLCWLGDNPTTQLPHNGNQKGVFISMGIGNPAKENIDYLYWFNLEVNTVFDCFINLIRSGSSVVSNLGTTGRENNFSVVNRSVHPSYESIYVSDFQNPFSQLH